MYQIVFNFFGMHHIRFYQLFPSLSAFYMQQFNQFAAEKELNLAEAIKRKYCSYCGSIFLPGLNSQVRIEKNRKRNRRNKKKKSIDKEVISDHNLVGQPEELDMSKQEKEKRQIINIYNNPRSATALLNNQKQIHAKRQHYKNHVSYVCNFCNRETRFAGIAMRDVKQVSGVKQQKEGTSNFITSISQASAKDSSSRCKRTKKQKKTQLQQLLAEEKRKSSCKRDDFNDSSDGLSLANFLSVLY